MIFLSFVWNDNLIVPIERSFYRSFGTIINRSNRTIFLSFDWNDKRIVPNNPKFRINPKFSVRFGFLPVYGSVRFRIGIFMIYNPNRTELKFSDRFRIGL